MTKRAALWRVECPNCFVRRHRKDHRWDRERENRQPLKPCETCGKETEWRTNK